MDYFINYYYNCGMVYNMLKNCTVFNKKCRAINIPEKLVMKRTE